MKKLDYIIVIAVIALSIYALIYLLKVGTYKEILVDSPKTEYRIMNSKDIVSTPVLPRSDNYCEINMCKD